MVNGVLCSELKIIKIIMPLNVLEIKQEVINELLEL